MVLGGGELDFEFVAASAYFGAALVDVADQVMADAVGELKVADQALAPGLGVGDSAAEGCDLAAALVPSTVVAYYLVCGE